MYSVITHITNLHLHVSFPAAFSENVFVFITAVSLMLLLDVSVH